MWPLQASFRDRLSWEGIDAWDPGEAPPNCWRKYDNCGREGPWLKWNGTYTIESFVFELSNSQKKTWHEEYYLNIQTSIEEIDFSFLLQCYILINEHKFSVNGKSSSHLNDHTTPCSPWDIT